MKDAFEESAETPPKKLERREAELKQIDKSLSPDRPPQPQLRPDGAMRARGDAVGRNLSSERRVDLRAEIAELKEIIDKSPANDRGIDPDEPLAETIDI